jgi:hypothetical protein
MAMRLVVALLAAALALAGCSVRPVAVKPARALATALAHPAVAAWHTAHSAPQVLAGMNPAAVKGLGRYRPVAMVDLVREGLLVRFDSALGPRPRRVEVIIDNVTGAVLEVTVR